MILGLKHVAVISCFSVKKFYVCASVGILLNNSTICTVQQQEWRKWYLIAFIIFTQSVIIKLFKDGV